MIKKRNIILLLLFLTITILLITGVAGLDLTSKGAVIDKNGIKIKTKVNEMFVLSPDSKKDNVRGEWKLDFEDDLLSLEEKTELPVRKYVFKPVKSGKANVTFKLVEGDNILDRLDYIIDVEENKVDYDLTAPVNPGNRRIVNVDLLTRNYPKKQISEEPDSKTNDNESEGKKVLKAIIEKPEEENDVSDEETGEITDDLMTGEDQTSFKADENQPQKEIETAVEDSFIDKEGPLNNPEIQFEYIKNLFENKSYDAALKRISVFKKQFSDNNLFLPEVIEFEISINDELHNYDRIVELLNGEIDRAKDNNFLKGSLMLRIADTYRKKETYLKNNKPGNDNSEQLIPIAMPQEDLIQNEGGVEKRIPQIEKSKRTYLEIASIYSNSSYPNIAAKAYLELAFDYAEDQNLKQAIDQLIKILVIPVQKETFEQNNKDIVELYEKVKIESYFILGLIYNPHFVISDDEIEKRYKIFKSPENRDYLKSYNNHRKIVKKYKESKFYPYAKESSEYLKRNFIDYR